MVAAASAASPIQPSLTEPGQPVPPTAPDRRDAFWHSLWKNATQIPARIATAECKLDTSQECNPDTSQECNPDTSQECNPYAGNGWRSRRSSDQRSPECHPWARLFVWGVVPTGVVATLLALERQHVHRNRQPCTHPAPIHTPQSVIVTQDRGHSDAFESTFREAKSDLRKD